MNRKLPLKSYSIISVFTVNFNKFNATLLNKSINWFIKTLLIDRKPLKECI